MKRTTLPRHNATALVPMRPLGEQLADADARRRRPGLDGVAALTPAPRYPAALDAAADHVTANGATPLQLEVLADASREAVALGDPGGAGQRLLDVLDGADGPAPTDEQLEAADEITRIIATADDPAGAAQQTLDGFHAEADARLELHLACCRAGVLLEYGPMPLITAPVIRNRDGNGVASYLVPSTVSSAAALDALPAALEAAAPPRPGPHITVLEAPLPDGEPLRVERRPDGHPVITVDREQVSSEKIVDSLLRLKARRESV